MFYEITQFGGFIYGKRKGFTAESSTQENSERLQQYDYRNKGTDNGRNGHFQKSMHTRYRQLELEGPAGIKKEGQATGSRATRHHAASPMLRAGVPMPDISAAPGHGDPNIVSVYLSTGAGIMAACTLPLPPVRKGAPDKKSVEEFLEKVQDTPGSLYNAVSFLREFSRYLIARRYKSAYLIPSGRLRLLIPVQPYFFTKGASCIIQV